MEEDSEYDSEDEILDQRSISTTSEDSEDEILDQRSIASTSEDSEDEILNNHNRSLNDSATVYMDWIDHDMETLACENDNYSDLIDDFASLAPVTETVNLIQHTDGEVNILEENVGNGKFKSCQH